jgi:protein SCO1
MRHFATFSKCGYYVRVLLLSSMIKVRRMMKKSLIFLSIILLAIVVGALLFNEQLAGRKNSGEVSIGGAFSLTDQNGIRVTDANFKGKDTLVFFGFTNCPDICPTTLAVVTNVMEGLGDAGKNLTPVFISVDANDDVAVMKTYLGNFHPAIIGLTGTAEEIKAAAKSYRVYYSRVEQPDTTSGYTMDHSAFLYFMDQNGKYVAHFSHNDSAEKIIATIKPYLEK